MVMKDARLLDIYIKFTLHENYRKQRNYREIDGRRKVLYRIDFRNEGTADWSENSYL